MRPKIRRGLFVVSAAVLWLLLAAAPTLADGAPTIAQAPVVVYGQQEFGNTADGGLDPRQGINCPLDSWWLLPTVAGDNVTIDFEGDNSILDVLAFPVGTNDFNLPSNEGALSERGPGANGKGEMVPSATVSGDIPIEFQGTDRVRCEDATAPEGPYDFVARVTHTVRLFVPRLGVLRRSATVKVSVHAPDGSLVNDPALKVSVQLRRPQGSWRTVGVSAVTRSIAAVRVKIPRLLQGRAVSLRVRATGPNYYTATSAAQQVQTR
jgi:hypothetical protein